MINMREFSDLFDEQCVCPVCNTSNKAAVQAFCVMQLDYNIDVLKCHNCGLLYKKYFPSINLLNLIYSKNYIHFKEPDVVNFKSSSRLKRLGEPKGKLLDYGCGGGGFVFEARNAGWDAYGCDPFLPSHLDNNILFFNDDATDKLMLGHSKFDIITMWAVVEHLKVTSNVFINLAQLLTPGGSLIFNSPYGGSMLAKKNGSLWAMAVLVEHLQFHTKSSVASLADLCGLQVESIRICGTPFPFGRTNPINQGVPLDLFDCQAGTPISEQDIKPVAPVFGENFKNFLKSYVDVQSGDAFLANRLRELISFFGIGDHIEVKLKKSN